MPFFLRAGPQLGTGDGTTLQPITLPRDYAVVLALEHGAVKTSTGDVYAAFDRRHGEREFDERRAALAGALGATTTLADLARLPRNDLASSPLADELRALGAFRADVTGAGPVVYGLFESHADAGAAVRRARGPRDDLDRRSRLIPSFAWHPRPHRARRERSRAPPAAQPRQGRARGRGGGGRPRPHRRDPLVARHPARARRPRGVRGVGREHESADVRIVTWTAAVSQLIVVLVPVLAGALVVLAAVAVVAVAALALAALLLDRR